MGISINISNEQKQQVLQASLILMRMHKEGLLGGDIMPEDANPGLGKGTDENYLYFTLPMSLNFQRNSYKLWESANRTYKDLDTACVFSPNYVASIDIEILREKLLKHKVALQPNKHTQIWFDLCRTFSMDFNGNIKDLFSKNGFSISQIKNYILANKKQFPYLSGAKIMNYWLYVMCQYTDANFKDRESITVAPDTHVLQASIKLGLIKHKDLENIYIREIVSQIWEYIFDGTEWCPIDIHTPLWLWSRGGFVAKVGEYGGEFPETGIQLHF
jgi:hypothetical protein